MDSWSARTLTLALTLTLTLTQVNYLIGPEWTSDPTKSEGTATNGTVKWESAVVSVNPILSPNPNPNPEPEPRIPNP